MSRYEFHRLMGAVFRFLSAGAFMVGVLFGMLDEGQTCMVMLIASVLSYLIAAVHSTVAKPSARRF